MQKKNPLKENDPMCCFSLFTQTKKLVEYIILKTNAKVIGLGKDGR